MCSLGTQRKLDNTLGIHMHQHTDKGNLTGFICVEKFGSEIKHSNENSR